MKNDTSAALGHFTRHQANFTPSGTSLAAAELHTEGTSLSIVISTERSKGSRKVLEQKFLGKRSNRLERRKVKTCNLSRYMPHCDDVILNRLACEESLFFLFALFRHLDQASARGEIRPILVIPFGFLRSACRLRSK